MTTEPAPESASTSPDAPAEVASAGTPATPKALAAEATRRRTFAVISHPDAGKSTLTEALALHAKMISEAGAMHGKAGRRSTVSDWMEMEKARGISVSSTALQFKYKSAETEPNDDQRHQPRRHPGSLRLLRGHLPGAHRGRRRRHADRRRQGPRAADPQAVPGVPPPRHPGHHRDQQVGPPGPDAAGTARRDPRADRPDPDAAVLAGRHRRRLPRPAATRRGRRRAEYIRFTRTAGGATIAPEEILDADAAAARDGDEWETAVEESELLSASGQDHDQEMFLAGQTSPVIFALRDAELRRPADPRHPGRRSRRPRRRAPTSRATAREVTDPFSAVVFKVQAGMDTAHRDRLAFMRIVSGVFERGMVVTHAQTGKPFATKYAQTVFGRDRSTVETAYPGDVVGLVNATALAPGHTLFTDKKVEFPPIPSFAPEHFSVLRARERRASTSSSAAPSTSSTPRASCRCCATTCAATRRRCWRPSARCSSRWSPRG